MSSGHAAHTDHHALLLIGERGAAYACIPEHYRTESTDVHIVDREVFTIADARYLRERSGSRPVTADRRRFVISAHSILREAQHALLKLFEDPPATAQFFVILQNDHDLLPTLRSRFHIIAVSDPDSTARATAASFISLSDAERLAEIKRRVDVKDIEWVRALLRGLELYLSSKKTAEAYAALCELVRVSRYIEARGASKKMLLEHLALLLPTA